MKGISPFIAAVAMVAIVIAAVGIISPLIFDVAKSQEAGVERAASYSMDCRMGIVHIESFSANGDVRVTVENIGETELSGLKIVAYNESGSYTYDASPGSLSAGSKVTLTSAAPGGTVWKVKVLTGCPGVYDEYMITTTTIAGSTTTSVSTTSTTTTTTTTLVCGSYINFDTYVPNDITGCTGTILYINASSVTLDCQNHYLQSTGSRGINNTGFDNVTVKNCVLNMSGVYGTSSIYYNNADEGKLINNTVFDSYYGIYLYSSSNNTLINNTVRNNINGMSMVWYDSQNNFTGGSVYGNNYDYYLYYSAGTDNYFTDTNFTGQREIHFDSDCGDSCWFNYRNDTTSDIWLKTNAPTASENAAQITRELINWDQDLVLWNDSGYFWMVNYNVSGLLPSTDYDISNNSVLMDTLQTDSNGVLPSFTIALDGEHEIRVENTCLLAGTKVSMFDGSKKNIEDVSVGDYVVSYDTEKKTYEKSKVLKVFEHENPTGYYLTINSVLKVTPNHRIFSEGKWARADSLREGDKILFGKVFTIEKSCGKSKVYNIEVEHHNYFAEGFLVHNTK